MVYYFLIYWLVCAIIGVCIRYFSTRNDLLTDNSEIKPWLQVILLAPLIPPLLPIIIPCILIDKFYIKPKEKKKMEQRSKEREQKENEIKAKVGLRPDESYVRFSRMGGAGVIKCLDCGHQEEITCFVHGAMSAEIGRQCPKCHAFCIEHNESKEYHQFGEATEDLKCPKCGTIIRKKEESIFKGNDDPLFCPKCHSARLTYTMRYIT